MDSTQEPAVTMEPRQRRASWPRTTSRTDIPTHPAIHKGAVGITDSPTAGQTPPRDAKRQKGSIYWPELRKQLMSRYVAQRLTISTIDCPENPNCIICDSSQLHVAGFKPQSDTNYTERAALLACGHVVGLDCMSDWKAHCASVGRPTTCPVCRHNLDAALSRCRLHIRRPIRDISAEPPTPNAAAGQPGVETAHAARAADSVSDPCVWCELIAFLRPYRLNWERLLVQLDDLPDDDLVSMFGLGRGPHHPADSLQFRATLKRCMADIIQAASF